MLKKISQSINGRLTNDILLSNKEIDKYLNINTVGYELKYIDLYNKSIKEKSAEDLVAELKNDSSNSIVLKKLFSKFIDHLSKITFTEQENDNLLNFIHIFLIFSKYDKESWANVDKRLKMTVDYEELEEFNIQRYSLLTTENLVIFNYDLSLSINEIMNLNNVLGINLDSTIDEINNINNFNSLSLSVFNLLKSSLSKKDKIEFIQLHNITIFKIFIEFISKKILGEKH